MRVEIGSATDIGRVRERNEDSLLVRPPLFIVADGMGGHRGGDVASQLAVETMERLVAGEDRGSLGDHVREANRAVFDRASEDQGLSGMGTTLTAVRLDGDSVELAHVGDSRAYLLRAGSLSKLTTDHTLVERMLRAGEITEAEAEVHPHKNVMTRALGTEADIDVDERSVALEDGDRLLLCSDGLTGMVTEDQIQAILEESPGPQDAASRLVRAANRAGGVDNISVVVLEAHGEGGGGGGGTIRGDTAPRSFDRRSVARWALRIGLPVLVVVVLLVGARWYLDRQWYVASNQGSVAIFQGVPLTIVGYDLGHPYLTYDDLPASEVEELPAYDLDDGVSFGSLDEAEAHVAQIRQDLEEARRRDRLQERDGQAQGGGGG